MVEVVRYAPGVSGEENSLRFQRLKNMKITKCYYDGVEFPSISSLARSLNVSNSTISKRFKFGEYRGLKLSKIKKF